MNVGTNKGKRQRTRQSTCRDGCRDLDLVSCADGAITNQCGRCGALHDGTVQGVPPELVARFFAAIDCIESAGGGEARCRAITPCCMRFQVDPVGVLAELNDRMRARRDATRRRTR